MVIDVSGQTTDDKRFGTAFCAAGLKPVPETKRLLDGTVIGISGTALFRGCIWLR